MKAQTLFGSKLRTDILLAIGMLEETYASELARLLGVSFTAVQRILEGLENDGVLIGRLVGRTRFIQIDQKWFGAKPLSELLRTLGERNPDLRNRIESVRLNPRNRDKPI
jgi:predicted transcriptional regulator